MSKVLIDAQELEELKQLALFGRAALMPGLKRAATLLEQAIEDNRQKLNGQKVNAPGTQPPPPVEMQLTIEAPGKRRKKAKYSAGVKGYWARMTPEERSAEMQRRMSVHRGDAPSIRAVPIVKTKRSAA